jgi:hypothetical protein
MTPSTPSLAAIGRPDQPSTKQVRQLRLAVLLHPPRHGVAPAQAARLAHELERRLTDLGQGDQPSRGMAKPAAFSRFVRALPRRRPQGGRGGGKTGGLVACSSLARAVPKFFSGTIWRCVQGGGGDLQAKVARAGTCATPHSLAEAYTQAACGCCLTKPAQRTGAMRKYRSFADGLADGSNRPQARVPELDSVRAE